MMKETLTCRRREGKKQLMEGEKGMVVGVSLEEKERWVYTEISLVEKVKMQRAKIK